MVRNLKRGLLVFQIRWNNRMAFLSNILGALQQLSLDGSEEIAIARIGVYYIPDSFYLILIPKN